MLRKHGDSDRGTGIDFVLADPERGIQRPQRLGRRQHRHGGTIDDGEDAGKIVPAQLAEQIVRTQHVGTQQSRDARAHRIAHLVAPHRVDAADHAAFDEQHGKMSAVGPAFRDPRPQR